LSLVEISFQVLTIIDSSVNNMFILAAMARPREFNPDIVGQKIMNLFWQKGYARTSVQELVDATGLKKGSLYSCFGKKSEIFKFALLRYCRPAEDGPRSELSPLNGLAAFFSKIVKEADLPKAQRRGCFLMNSALEFGNQNHELSATVRDLVKAREQHFERLILAAQASGEMSSKLDSRQAAQRAFATAFTIREMCKFKPEKDFLQNIANSYLESLGVSQRVHL